MSDIHQLRLARWKRIQERGIWRFAIFQGVLLWGGAMWIIFAILGWSRYTHQEWLRFIVLVLVAAVVTGFLFGILMYAFTMWTYRRYRRRFS